MLTLHGSVEILEKIEEVVDNEPFISKECYRIHQVAHQARL
jgi:hypothetical protein